MRFRLVAVVALGTVLTVGGCGTSDESRVGPATSSVFPPTESEASDSAPDPFAPGLTDHSISINDVEREYRVYVPESLSSPRALIVVLHGGGGDGATVADSPSEPLAVFRTIADREGAVVVYPQGLPARDRAGDRAGWDDCRNDNTVASGADDVDFLSTLITEITGAYALSKDATFVAGTSNGAQMAQSLAFSRPDLLGAIATFAGNSPAEPKPGPCTDGPSQPVAVLLAHGTADTVMPYDGGCVADFSGACSRGAVISAEATLNQWLEINGLTDVLPSTALVDLNPDDSGPAYRIDYPGPVPVQWWRFEGSGHPTASRLDGVTAPRTAGLRNSDVEFADIAWAFFATQLPTN